MNVILPIILSVLWVVSFLWLWGHATSEPKNAADTIEELRKEVAREASTLDTL